MNFKSLRKYRRGRNSGSVTLTWSAFLMFSLLERLLEKVSLSQEPLNPTSVTCGRAEHLRKQKPSTEHSLRDPGKAGSWWALGSSAWAGEKRGFPMPSDKMMSNVVKPRHWKPVSTRQGNSLSLSLLIYSSSLCSSEFL